jgi:cell division transport system permease protein
MIGAFLAASPAESRLLGGGRLEGPMPFVIAIMMFVMVVIGAAGLALGQAASIAARGIDQRFTVQVDGNAAAAPALAATLGKTPGVIAVRPVPEADMRRTLERWMGPQAAAEDLPLPAMIDLEFAPGVAPDAVARAVALVPGARLVAHHQTLGPALSALRGLGLLAAALVILIALATAASVILATKGALDTQRSTIEIMHGVGATDDQIARLFQRKMALDALVGGTIGATVAGVVLLLIGGGASRWLSDLTIGPLLGPLHILALAMLPVLGTILATLAARRAVLRHLGVKL